MTLFELGQKHGTDKAWHQYTSVYDDLFRFYDRRPVRLLEIGILGGHSLRMWAEYFANPASEIVGVDIHDRGFESDDRRISTIYGDAGNPDMLQSLPGDFDIVIEDGGHFWSHQVTAFEYLFPKVKSGGYFITEDLHVVHSPQHADRDQSMIDYLAWVAREMQDHNGADGCAGFNPDHPFSQVDSITFRKGLAIIRKR